MKYATIASTLVLGAAAAASLAMTAPASAADHAKNVFIMVSDGCSWGCWDMMSYWEYGEKEQQPFYSFPVKLGMTTYPLNTSNSPTGSGIPQVSYDPAKAWDTTPTGNDNHFGGYEYIKEDYTDSAAAGSALATGQKTYNNAINFDDFGNPLPTIVHAAKDKGRATGSISSVPFSHATPATLGGAQNINRNNYHEISQQMLDDGILDVWMGAGNPEYDNSGKPRAEAQNNYQYISEEDWTRVVNGETDYTLITKKEDFDDIAAGNNVPTGKVFGVPEVANTLQYSRPDDVVEMGADPSLPSGVAYIPTVPTLNTMTQAALNILGQDEDGMYLHVEGGAVDWAAHANNTARQIEESIDFNNSVETVIDWVEANSSWDETLLLVLTDHGNGMPMGPESDTIAFQPIQNNGQGELPGVLWHYGTHTNENTLMFAKGAGSEMLFDYVVGEDFGLTEILAFNDGSYIENTSVFNVMAAALASPNAVPVPTSLAVLATGLVPLLAAARRRRTSKRAA